MAKTASSRRIVTISLIGSTIVILGLIWYRWATPANAMDIGKRFRDAIMRGDCNTALSLMSDQELRENGMSHDDFCRFVNDWVRPRLVRVADDDSEVVAGNARNGVQSYQWGVVTSRGKLPLSVSVAKTDDGLKVVQPITGLVFTFLCVTPSGGLPRSAEEKLETWSVQARKLGGELASYHVRTLHLRPEDDAMTLGAFADWCDQRLSSLRSRQVSVR